MIVKREIESHTLCMTCNHYLNFRQFLSFQNNKKKLHPNDEKDN